MIEEQKTESLLVDQSPKEGGVSDTVVSSTGKIEKAVVPEDKYVLDEKMLDLKEQIQKYTDTIEGAKRSQEIHGVPFSTLVDNVEVTPELVEQKKKELADIQSLRESLKPKKKHHPFSIIGKAFFSFFHF